MNKIWLMLDWRNYEWNHDDVRREKSVCCRRRGCSWCMFKPNDIFEARFMSYFIGHVSTLLTKTMLAKTSRHAVIWFKKKKSAFVERLSNVLSFTRLLTRISFAFLPWNCPKWKIATWWISDLYWKRLFAPCNLDHVRAPVLRRGNKTCSLNLMLIGGCLEQHFPQTYTSCTRGKN